MSYISSYDYEDNPEDMRDLLKIGMFVTLCCGRSVEIVDEDYINEIINNADCGYYIADTIEEIVSGTGYCGLDEETLNKKL